jgi:hypothetical protein
MFGSARVMPIATTSLATAGAVRRWRNTSHSRVNPSSGASSTTDTTKAGTTPQPHSTRVVKNTSADTYAWAPKARLNTPEVL